MSGLRERNRQDQRARILDAAFELFAEHGFDDVTVAGVAERAGVARATVFNHFDSKQGLIEAITTLVLGFYQGMLDNALAQPDVPAPVLLRALFDQMATGIETTRRFQRGVFREIARLQLGFDEGGPADLANQAIQTRLVKLFARGQERGELSREHAAETLSFAFNALANGTITAWLFDDGADSLRDRMRATVEIFLAPVASDAAATRESPLPTLMPSDLWRWTP